jgi:hypothetical protein
VPLFDKLLADSDGRVWLRDFVPDGDTNVTHDWTVFGPDGHVQARVRLPAHLRVMHIGRDHVTGVVQDSLDVEYVVSHRVTHGQTTPSRPEVSR